MRSGNELNNEDGNQVLSGPEGTFVGWWAFSIIVTLAYDLTAPISRRI